MSLLEAGSNLGRVLQPNGVGVIALVGSTTIDLINSAPRTGQVSTLTPSAGTAGETLVLTILPAGESIAASLSLAITASHSTDVLLGAAIAAAWNSNPAFYGWATAAANGATGVVTITAAEFAGALTLTASVDGGTGTTTVAVATSTASANADAIPFGRLVVSTGYSTVREFGPNATPKCVLARSSRLTARADAITLTYEAAIAWTVSVEFEGTTYTASVTMAVDADTSVTAMQAAIAGVLPTGGPVATNAGAVLTITAPVGYSMASWSRFAAGAATAAASTAATGEGINDVVRGVSVATVAEEQPVGGGDPVYPGGAGLAAMDNGVIHVETAENPTFRDPVYVDISDSTEAGRFYTSAGPNRIRLRGASWGRSYSSLNRAELALKAA